LLNLDNIVRIDVSAAEPRWQENGDTPEAALWARSLAGSTELIRGKREMCEQVLDVIAETLHADWYPSDGDLDQHLPGGRPTLG
jgi:hypothetical protein